MPEVKSEEQLKQKIINLLKEQGYILQDKSKREKNEDIYWNDLFLVIERINHKLFKKLKFLDKQKTFIKREINSCINKNEKFYNLLTKGIDVIFDNDETRSIKLIDFNIVDNNIFSFGSEVVPAHNNKFDIDKNQRNDLVVYINGMPLIIFELKFFNFINETENDSLKKAYKQIAYNDENKDNYANNYPSLFSYNFFIVIGHQKMLKYGSHKTPLEIFSEWNYIDKEIHSDFANKDRVEIFIKGLFNKKRLINLLENFVFYFEENKIKYKIIAKYHQFYSVNNLFKSIKEKNNFNIPERNFGGHAYHSPSSGKTYQMLFLSSMIDRKLEEFIIIVLADRISIHRQIFKTFQKAKQYLYAPIISPNNSKKLKDELDINKSASKIIISNMQKFTDDYKGNINKNKNIVVIIDEAHRTQNYNDSKELNNELLIKDGWAKTMRKVLPNAIFVGFTGTPIFKDTGSTKEIFGEELSRYNIADANRDNAIVNLVYEEYRLNITLNDQMIKESLEHLNKMKSKNKINKNLEKWEETFATRVKIILEQDNFIKSVAKKVVEDWTKQLNLNQDHSINAMLIVSSKKIALKYYHQIVDIEKPFWRNNVEIEVSLINKGENDELKKIVEKNQSDRDERFKNKNNKFNFVILVDKWTTGFDVPQLHKMYIAKILNGHNLIQTFSRVIRISDKKTKGFIMDFAMNKYEYQKALDVYGNKNDVKAMMKDYDWLAKEFINNFQEIKKLIPKTIAKIIADLKSKKLESNELNKENYIVNELLVFLIKEYPDFYNSVSPLIKKTWSQFKAIPYNNFKNTYEFKVFPFLYLLYSKINSKEKETLKKEFDTIYGDERNEFISKYSKILNVKDNLENKDKIVLNNLLPEEKDLIPLNIEREYAIALDKLNNNVVYKKEELISKINQIVNDYKQNGDIISQVRAFNSLKEIQNEIETKSPNNLEIFNLIFRDCFSDENIKNDKKLLNDTRDLIYIYNWKKLMSFGEDELLIGLKNKIKRLLSIKVKNKDEIKNFVGKIFKYMEETAKKK